MKRVHFSVMLRAPGAVSLKKAQQGIGVRLKVGLQASSEQAGPQPAKPLVIFSLILCINGRGAAFATIGCPVTPVSDFGFLYVLVQFVFFLGIKEIHRSLLLIIIGEPGIEHFGVLSSDRKRKVVAYSVKKHVVAQQVSLD